jgi:hypothetical protein
MRILRVLWARIRGMLAGSSADGDMREEFESLGRHHHGRGGGA